VPPTEYDVCVVREIFDLRWRWRNAIDVVQALSQFVNYKGTDNNNDNR
jgi:hypothetical protein